MNTTKPLPPPPIAALDPKMKTPFSSPLSSPPDSSPKAQGSEASPKKSIRSVDKPLPATPGADVKQIAHPTETISSLPHSASLGSFTIPARPTVAIAKDLIGALEELYLKSPPAFWEGIAAHNAEAEITFRVAVTGKFRPPVEGARLRSLIGGRPESGHGGELGGGNGEFGWGLGEGLTIAGLSGMQGNDCFEGFCGEWGRVREWVEGAGSGEVVGGNGGEGGVEGMSPGSEGSKGKEKTLRRLKGVLGGKGGAM